jgi:molybdate transport system substrate-binding protein
MVQRALVLLALCSLAAACDAGSPRAEISVFAAASLRDAVEAAAAAYEATNRGVDVVVATDSSAALRAQIEQGATPDLFLSADVTTPKELVDAGLAQGPPVPFAQNELAIVVPASNPADITSPADLARSGVKVIAAGEAVPITAYAAGLIVDLGLRPGYPPGYAQAYEANVVTREDNVAGVIAKIGLGEGDAAIVYRTDVAAADDVLVIPIPGGITAMTTLAGVIVGEGRHPAKAGAFFDWLLAADGQAVLARFGFLPPPRE